MKILKIEHINKTDKEDYTLITFKKWHGKPFSKICITPNWNINTYYANSGESIPTNLWDVVKAFIRMGDKFHEY